jgi:nicotinate-nucleotide--dimethylbenzimidazole phosphoribosyltransferase
MEQRLFNAAEVKVLEEIILHRRDVRGNRFKQDPISDEVLEKILLAAVHGPSVGFSQPWEFVVIRDPETKLRVRKSFNEENSQATHLFEKEKALKYAGLKLEGILESPLNLAVFYKPSRVAVLGQTSMKEVGLYSVVCAIQNMWLMARALNVGIGWVSILDPKKVKTILQAPDENQLVAYLCLGYVHEFTDKPELEILEWEKRKVLSRLVLHEKYTMEKNRTFHIRPLSKDLAADLTHKINFKTKPLGALGRLEELALQIGLVQNTLSPVLKNPAIVVFAGDHGVVAEGVSAYPQEVTFQMVMNFLAGGAAINVFCKQNGIELNIVDAGVNYDFPNALPGLTRLKIGHGTKNFKNESAMSREDLHRAIRCGAKVVEDLHAQGCNVIGFGEMGIGNTASASAIMSVLCNLPVEECVGKGTGLDAAGVSRKVSVIREAIGRYTSPMSPWDVLEAFGGYEIVQMCGAMLAAAELNMLILVDGFIASAAFLAARQAEPGIQEYAVFCHQSGEQGHKKMLDFMQVRSVLQLDMRLGEGTGAALCYPLIQSAVAFLNNMASFESAAVSEKDKTPLV